MISGSPTLYCALTSTPTSPTTRLVRDAVIVLTGTLLIALSARIQVPMWPVPMTMQTLAILMIAMSVGARLATITLGVYLAQGALGLPVFASGGGIAYFAGPTAGFLWGFLAAATVTGWLADRGFARTFPGAFAVALVGSLTIYVIGAGYLGLAMGFGPAIEVAVLPFLLSDLVKAVLVALLLTTAHNVISQRR